MRPYQLHYRADSSVYVYTMIAEDGDQAGRATNGRKLNEGRVVVHKRFEIFSAFRDHPVKFARQDGGISGDDLLALGKNRSGDNNVRSEKGVPCS